MTPFYLTPNGTTVIRTPQFHVHANVSDDLLIEAMLFNGNSIDNAYREGHDVIISFDCGYTIGHSLCVECPIGTPNVYFKVREPRQYQSRMIHGAIPKETSMLTMVLKYRKESMLLVTAWAGYPAQPEIGNITYFEQSSDPMEDMNRCAEFWFTHALIEENPTVEDLLIDLKIISHRLGMDLNVLSIQQIQLILAERLCMNPMQVPNDQLCQDVMIKYKETIAVNIKSSQS